MNALDINNINLLSPYTVAEISGRLHFRTDHDVEYIVTFDQEDNPFFSVFWFNLTNPSHSKSPNDPKIPKTIICIIEEFFKENPDILLYLCSSEGGKQAQRARLFLKWFNGAEQQKHYIIRTAEVKGEDGQSEYVALIAQRSNPHIAEILELFDNDTTMFPPSRYRWREGGLHWAICRSHFLHTDSYRRLRSSWPAWLPL